MRSLVGKYKFKDKLMPIIEKVGLNYDDFLGVREEKQKKLKEVLNPEEYREYNSFLLINTPSVQGNLNLFNKFFHLF